MLILLTVVLVLSDSTWFSATAIIPQISVEWHLGAAAAAWMTITVQGGFAAGAIFSSVLNIADVLSAPRLIFMSSAGAAAANLLLLSVHDALLGSSVRLITGFFIAGVYPPAIKLISTWYPDGRGLAVGIMVGALNIGAGIPYLVNGLGGLNWHVVIMSTSLATIAGGIIIILFITNGPYPFPRAAFDPRQLQSILRDTGTRLSMLGYWGHMWELYAMWAWFLLFISDALRAHGHRGAVLPSMITLAIFVVGAAATCSGGWMGDRFGRERTAIAMMAVSAGCAACIGLAFHAPVWLLILVAMIWAYSVVGDSAQFTTLVTELAGPSYIGTALTLQMAVGYGLSGFTIWLIPVVQHAVGWRWTFNALVPGPLCGIIMMRSLLRHRARQAASPGSLC